MQEKDAKKLKQDLMNRSNNKQNNTNYRHKSESLNKSVMEIPAEQFYSNTNKKAKWSPHHFMNNNWYVVISTETTSTDIHIKIGSTRSVFRNFSQQLFLYCFSFL